MVIFLILKTLKITRVKICTVPLQIPLSLLTHTHTHLKNTSSTVGQIKMSAALSLVADLSLSRCDSSEKITDCL